MINKKPVDECSLFNSLAKITKIINEEIERAEKRGKDKTLEEINKLLK